MVCFFFKFLLSIVCFLVSYEMLFAAVQTAWIGIHTSFYFGLKTQDYLDFSFFGWESGLSFNNIFILFNLNVSAHSAMWHPVKQFQKCPVTFTYCIHAHLIKTRYNAGQNSFQNRPRVYIYVCVSIHIHIYSSYIYIFVHTYTILCDAKKQNVHISYKIVTKTGKCFVCSAATICSCLASERICPHLWKPKQSPRFVSMYNWHRTDRQREEQKMRQLGSASTDGGGINVNVR